MPAQTALVLAAVAVQHPAKLRLLLLLVAGHRLLLLLLLPLLVLVLMKLCWVGKGREWFSCRALGSFQALGA
jgi:hypothetical protein